RLNDYTPNEQIQPNVAFTPRGDLVAAWMSLGQDGDGFGVFGRIFPAASFVPEGEFQINAWAPDAQSDVKIAAKADGSFVAVYDARLQDGVDYGVYAQRFNAQGVPVGPEIRVNQTTVGNQEAPSVAMDAAGNFVVAWQSPGGPTPDIWARRYD